MEALMDLFGLRFEFSAQRRVQAAQLFRCNVRFNLIAERLHRRTELRDLGGIDLNGMFGRRTNCETIAVNSSSFGFLQLIQFVDRLPE